MPASPTVVQGGSISATVSISGLGDGTAPSIGAYDIDLTFDPAVLSFVNVQFGDLVLLADFFDVNPAGLDPLTLGTETSPGVVRLLEISFNSAAELELLQPGAFQLATINFVALATGQTDLVLVPSVVSDPYGDPITPLVLEAATIRAVAVSAVPEPSSVFLLGIGLAGFARFRRRKRAV